MLKYGVRQAGPAQSDRDVDVTENFPALEVTFKPSRVVEIKRRGGARHSGAGAAGSHARSSTSSTTGRKPRARRGSATSSSRSICDGSAKDRDYALQATAEVPLGARPGRRWRAGRSQNFCPERVEAIRCKAGLKAGDVAFFVAGDPSKFAKFAGLARTKVGQDLKWSKKTGSSSAGSSTFRCSSGTRTRRRSTSRTIPSRCRRAASRR